MNNKIARIAFWCALLNTLAWGIFVLLFWAAVWAWAQVFV